jgi:hypothetical protein
MSAAAGGSACAFRKLARHRTILSKGRPSNRTALATVFKLVEAAQRRWSRRHPQA